MYNFVFFAFKARFSSLPFIEKLLQGLALSQTVNKQLASAVIYNDIDSKRISNGKGDYLASVRYKKGGVAWVWMHW